MAIFCLLMFGIVGLPIPDETLLTFSGYLIYKGTFSLPPAFATAFLGSACGITLSYVLGRTFGLGLIHRYGKWVRITPNHVMKAHAWFLKRGRWGLTFGYFVPGIRHFTAYAAGMSDLESKQFCLFAYSGAVLWISTFLGLGYFLGERWETVEKNIHHYLMLATLAGVILGLGYLGFRWWKKKHPAAQA